jgi:hypothetical protein
LPFKSFGLWSWPASARQNTQGVILCDSGDSDGANSIAERKRLVAGIHDVEPLEAEVLEGFSHGTAHLGRHRSLELEAEAPASANDEEIQLGSTVGAPKVALFCPGLESPD